MDVNNGIIKLLKNHWLHAGACGVLWALAFPRFDIAGLAWIVPGYLFLITRDCAKGDSFRLGYLTGLIAHLISLHWLLYIPVKFAPIVGWTVLCGYLALYPAAWTYLMRLLQEKIFKNPDGKIYAIFLPFVSAVFWTALEMVRARALTGFPWNLLGVSQYKMIDIIQIADITGVYGVSFLIVWISVAISVAIHWITKIEFECSFLLRPSTKWVFPLFIPFVAMCFLFWHNTKIIFHFMNAQENGNYRTHLKAVLIQPSIPQTMIWDKNENEKRFKKLIYLIKSALTNQPDLVILPEAAIPEFFRYHKETYKAVTDIAVENKVWMIIGADDVGTIDGNTNRVAFYNSSFLISTNGFIVGQYSKQHLVMFGEYVPLSRYLPFLKYLTPIGDGAFTPGRGPERFKFHVVRNGNRHDLETSVVICFEDVIPHLVCKHVDEKMDFLVNLTNDGWFGESAAQWQHLANAVFRAVENRRTLIRCTNNGISCCVDEIGAICNVNFQDPKNEYVEQIKICRPLVPSNALWKTTFYTRHGDVFGWGCVGIAFIALLFLIKQNGRGKSPSVS
ncbi:MAG: apolipoprotein N-acyltransferase [Verrucomicrobiae bacterium]|nr:apolipoprotein N-acyltransferase [Verrucomicrobiae bacterium]